MDGSGNVYAAGAFTNDSGYSYVAKWDGVNWNELGIGNSSLKANNVIASIALDGLGNVYAAGDFSNVNGYRYVAKWDGISWSELTILKNGNPIYNSITVDGFNNIYATG